MNNNYANKEGHTKMRKDSKRREKTQKDAKKNAKRHRKMQKYKNNFFLKAKRRKKTQKEAKSHKKIILKDTEMRRHTQINCVE